MPVRELTDNWSEGTHLGQSVSDKIGLFGVTPIVQPSASAQAAVTTATISSVTTTAPIATFGWGFATSEQATNAVAAINSLVTRVNSLSSLDAAIRTALVNLGIIKGSA
jgi:hypothetical protein